jgi:hypothetical protein
MSVLNFRASKVSRLSGLRALLNEKQRLAQTYQKGRAIQTALTPLAAGIMPTLRPTPTLPIKGRGNSAGASRTWGIGSTKMRNQVLSERRGATVDCCARAAMARAWCRSISAARSVK